MSLFVSYTRRDDTVVRALVEDLQRLGRPVWMDHNIHGGEPWWREIIQEIQRAKVFVFALSNDSWRSQPCRRELEYAEKLGIPILPVRVGPLDSMFISLAEKQIIDYCGRTADAVVGLVSALAELTARPPVLPNPLPPPPDVPFEYLYRIASVMGPTMISPDHQEELVGKLRRKLKEEDDEVARADIVKLMRELRDRRELTVQNAREIDEILANVEASTVEPEDGATRLPPTDHWRRAPAITEPEVTRPVQQAEESEAAEPPAIEPEPRTEPPAPPPETNTGLDSGASPAWLTDLIQRGGAGRKLSAATGPPATARPTTEWVNRLPAAGRPAEPANPRSVHPHEPPDSPKKVSGSRAATPQQSQGTSGSWAEQSAPAAPQQSQGTQGWWGAQPAAPKSPRLGFLAAVLGALGIPLFALAAGHSSATGQKIVLVVLLIVAAIGLAIGLLSASRREPGSRVAVVLAIAGLLGVITYAVVAGVF